jgi:hypothetical protein
MSLIFNRGKKELLDGTIDLVNDTIKAMLVTSSYTPNADDDFATAPAAQELSGTGYQAGFAGTGRKTLGTKTFSEDDPNDRGEFLAANLTWTGISAGTAAAVVLYKHLTSDAASVLIAYIDSGGFPKVTNGGDLSINWNAEGILQLS